MGDTAAAAPTRRFGRICVFCGSNSGNRAVFGDAALELGQGPGGYGTMEELLEMITWSQLGIHDKPVGLLNVDGYYDPLLALFDKGAAEGFIKADCRQIIVSAPTAHELLTKMEQYTRSHLEVASRTSWEMTELGYGKAAEEEK
ncbi:hypothetical protein ACQ4PT_063927 [Festuca glaucescens]